MGTTQKMYLSETEAREEVRIVVENILRYHPNPFHVTSKEVFYAEVDKLTTREGDIPIAHQFFALAKLASLIFDTHTQVHIADETPGFEASFPLRFRIFPDGLYIIAGSEAYRDAIGKKVVSISGHRPDDVLDNLAQHAFCDNLPRKRVFAEIFLYMPETYDVFNLKTSSGTIELRLEDLQGQQSTVELTETWAKGYADFSWDRLNPFMPQELLTAHDVWQTKMPFYLQHLSDNYWYQFLDDEQKYMYIQINQQAEKDDKHSLEFHLEWTKALWEAKSEMVIVDLRNDPGGTTTIGSGLPSFLQNMEFSHPDMRGIVVLFGLDTVSAGTILIAELESALWPVMIGAPTGSSPNMHLNAYKMMLPHSSFELEVSQMAFISVRDKDPRAYIAPDIPLELSFEDYAQGRDPLIEMAKTLTKEQMGAYYEGATPFTPWTRHSQEKALR